MSTEQARNIAHHFRGLATAAAETQFGEVLAREATLRNAAECIEKLAADHDLLILALRDAGMTVVDVDPEAARLSIHAHGDGYTPHAVTLPHLAAGRLAEILARSRAERAVTS